MRLERNGTGEQMCMIWFTEAEISELVLLIDDEEVDEDFLHGIRCKMAKKRKDLRRAIRDNQTTQGPGLGRKM